MKINIKSLVLHIFEKHKLVVGSTYKYIHNLLLRACLTSLAVRATYGLCTTARKEVLDYYCNL